MVGGYKYMKLLPHQVRFAKGYKDKALLAHEGGTGKTVCACVWLRDGRDRDALVIAPKRVIKKWQQALADWDTKATVISKETLKKTPIRQWSAIVVDEADEFASPLFTKNRSQLSVSLYELIKAYDMPTLLLTATPIRSNPWNIHTLLCFIHIYIDWKKWREVFFSLERRPFLRFPTWLPKPDWRKKVRKILERYADIVLLKDCVEYLPPVTQNIVAVTCEKFLGSSELTASGRFVEEHLHEQKDKHKHILDIAREYRKVIVVAHYVEQTEELEKQLSKDRETFMVNGSVRNQEDILSAAQASDECFLIVQASLGAGFDADTFSCVVFASMSYRVRDYVQMKFRIRRIHNLHPVSYNYLIAGRCDKAVYKIVEQGKDFVPSEWQ